MKLTPKNIGAATMLAGALIASCTTAHAQTTLADLQAGGTFTSGDLIFSDFGDISQVGNRSD